MYLNKGTFLHGGQYKIVRFISSGGFGCTYEAYDTLMETRVAIKEFFVKDYCNRDEATSHVTLATQSKRELVGKLRQKFMDEARALFKMKHDNIVRVNTFFEENDTAYYVMEYVDGCSLSDVLKKHGSLSETEMLGYIRQVAAALKYVHQQNRLHLDVKPGNILVDNTGKAVLIDFGASKHYDEGTGENTTTMQGLNTPGYAPYEQTVQGITEFKPASDIYALGATMYKLLTGVTPPNSGLLFLKKETLAPLPEAISSVTRNAITAAMQLHEEDRPQSIDKLLLMLDGNVEDDVEDESTVYRDDDKTIIDEKTIIVEPEPVSRPKQKHEYASKLKRTCKNINWKLISGIVAAVVAVVLIVVIVKNVSDKDIQNDAAVIIDGHECIDLGLSVKWATMNIGASKPKDYGEYFAWGETSDKRDYSWDTYFDSIDGSDSDFKKYVRKKNTTLDLEDDAAHVNWGGSWRMPTEAELDELRKSCTWTWIINNDVEGYKVTSMVNGNFIFLPAAGYRDGDLLHLDGSSGRYWSSSLKGSAWGYGCYGLDFNSVIVDWGSFGSCLGLPVRAVCP